MSHTTPTLPRLTAGLLLLIALAACGGGGSSSSSPTEDAAGDVGDTGAPDAVGDAAADVPPDLPGDVVEDGADAAPGDDAACPTGAFGCPCESDAVCVTGRCVNVGGQRLCVDPCEDGCSTGTSCAQVLDDGGEPAEVCLPTGALCRPCRAHDDCRAEEGADRGERCVTLGEAEGSVCATACVVDGECPRGYACQTTREVDTGLPTSQCVPVDLTCGCTAGAVEAGASTACVDACVGSRTCGDGGLSACEAPAPGEEACDGDDDDCDGQVDEGSVDVDGDGQADCVDEDDDGDGVEDGDDVCPLIADPAQADADADGTGDACAPGAPPSLLRFDPRSPGATLEPVVMGLAAPEEDVALYASATCEGEPVALATTDGEGRFEAELTVAPDTATRVSAAVAGEGGEPASGCALPLTYVHDGRAPSAPVLLGTSPPSPSMAPVPVVEGAAEPGARVTLFAEAGCAGEVAAEGAADASGAFFVPAPAARMTETEFSARATDRSGNASPCSEALAYVHAEAPPSAPVLTGSRPTSPSDLPWVVVLAEADPGGVVQVYADPLCQGEPLDSRRADALGRLEVGVSLEPGVNRIYAQAENPAGASACVGPLVLVYDDAPPAPPTLEATAPASPARDPSPQVVGAAEPGARVFIYAGEACEGEAIASALADEAGAFSLVVPVAPNAVTALSAAASDTSGQTSPCSAEPLSYVHDDVPPPAPTLVGLEPEPPSSEVTAPTVSGTADPGATIAVHLDGRCATGPVATTTADGEGAFSVEVDAPANAATPLSATATDAAGNTSGCAAPLIWTHADCSPPDDGPWKVWVGASAAPTRWDEAGNWEPAGAPAPGDAVAICAQAPTLPSVPLDTEVGDLVVPEGVTLAIQTLTVTGDLRVGGQVDNGRGGAVTLTGDGVLARGRVGTLTVTGRATLDGDLRAARLSLEGGGGVTLGGHTLEVEGRAGCEAGADPESGLVMVDPSDRLLVGGGLTLRAAAGEAVDTAGRFSAGEIVASGGVSITLGDRGAEQVAFTSSGTRLVLAGFNQSVLQYDPDALLGDVHVAEGAVVNLGTDLVVGGDLTLGPGAELNQGVQSRLRFTRALPQTTAGYQVVHTVVAGDITMDRSVSVPSRFEVEAGASLEVGPHTLSVGDSLRVTITDVEGDGLHMRAPSSTVIVGGGASFVTPSGQGAATSEGNLTDGKLILRGGLTAGGDGSGRGFVSTGTRVTFAGSAPQSLSFPNAAQAGSSLRDVEIADGAQVTLPTPVTVTGRLVMVGSAALSGSATTWPRFTSRLPITTAGYNVRTVVAGPVVMDRDAVIPAQQVQIEPGGSLTVGPHRLEIADRLRVTAGGDGDGLVMTDPAGEVVVGSDASFSGAAGPAFSTEGNLTAGTLRLRGNLTVGGDGNYAALVSTGTRLVLDGGGGLQLLAWLGDAPTASPLYDVEVTAGSEASVRADLSLGGGLSVAGALEVSVGNVVQVDGDVLLEQGASLTNQGQILYGGTFTDEGATINGDPPQMQ